MKFETELLQALLGADEPPRHVMGYVLRCSPHHFPQLSVTYAVMPLQADGDRVRTVTERYTVGAALKVPPAAAAWVPDDDIRSWGSRGNRVDLSTHSEKLYEMLIDAQNKCGAITLRGKRWIVVEVFGSYSTGAHGSYSATLHPASTSELDLEGY